MIKTILIDVDGVIADFDSHALYKLVGPAGMEAARAKREKGEWSIAKGLGISDSDFWRQVDNVFFWETIPPYEGAVDFIRSLYTMARDHYKVENFYFATSSGGSAEFPSARTRWIREFNKSTGVQIPLLIFQNIGDKKLCANSETLLIEDNDSGYEQFLGAGGYGVLVPRQWNKAIHNPSIGSVYDQTLDDIRRGLSGLAHDDIDR